MLQVTNLTAILGAQVSLGSIPSSTRYRVMINPFVATAILSGADIAQVWNGGVKFNSRCFAYFGLAI